METVNISDLRANLLSYLKKASEGSEIAVTSHGEVLATIVPPTDRFKTSRDKLKQLAKTAVLHDVISPTGERWDALK
jgi:prevent-host-death family protein